MVDMKKNRLSLTRVVVCIFAFLLMIACGVGSGAGEAPQQSSQGGNQEGNGNNQGSDNSSGKSGSSGNKLSSGDHPGGLFKSLPEQPGCQPTKAGDEIPDKIRVKRLDLLALCFAGFDEGGPQVAVRLTRSDGAERIYSTTFDGGKWEVYIEASLDLPLGNYDLRASQSSDGPAVTGRVRVVRASTPTVLRTGDNAQSGAAGVQAE